MCYQILLPKPREYNIIFLKNVYITHNFQTRDSSLVSSTTCTYIGISVSLTTNMQKL